jgi:hypothetical protein
MIFLVTAILYPMLKTIKSKEERFVSSDKNKRDQVDALTERDTLQ